MTRGILLGSEILKAVSWGQQTCDFEHDPLYVYVDDWCGLGGLVSYSRFFSTSALCLWLQEGQDPDVIAETLEVMSAAEPVVLDALRWSDLPDPLPRNTLKLHVPPRASNKITQTIRHTAAKAVAQLGLQVGGTADVKLCLWQLLAKLISQHTCHTC